MQSPWGDVLPTILNSDAKNPPKAIPFLVMGGVAQQQKHRTLIDTIGSAIQTSVHPTLLVSGGIKGINKGQLETLSNAAQSTMEDTVGGSVQTRNANPPVMPCLIAKYENSGQALDMDRNGFQVDTRFKGAGVLPVTLWIVQLCRLPYIGGGGGIPVDLLVDMICKDIARGDFNHDSIIKELTRKEVRHKVVQCVSRRNRIAGRHAEIVTNFTAQTTYADPTQRFIIVGDFDLYHNAPPHIENNEKAMVEFSCTEWSCDCPEKEGWENTAVADKERKPGQHYRGELLNVHSHQNHTSSCRSKKSGTKKKLWRELHKYEYQLGSFPGGEAFGSTLRNDPRIRARLKAQQPRLSVFDEELYRCIEKPMNNSPSITNATTRRVFALEYWSIGILGKIAITCQGFVNVSRRGSYFRNGAQLIWAPIAHSQLGIFRPHKCWVRIYEEWTGLNNLQELKEQYEANEKKNREKEGTKKAKKKKKKKK